MKTIKYLTIWIVSSTLFLQSCGDETPDKEEIFLEKISGISWKITKADIDGKDVTNSFPGLKVEFNQNKSITVTNAVPPMWKSSSTFTMKEAGSSFTINRDDGLTITVMQPTDTKLILRFQYDATAMGGRLSSVNGQFTMEFNAD